MRLIIAPFDSSRGTCIALLAALEDAGLLDRVEVNLSDWAGAAEAFEAAHEGGERAVFAFSLMTRCVPEARAALQELAALKKPGDVFLAGGPHPSARPRETLEMGADAVVVGEGEIAFVEFVNRLLEGDDWRGTPSLWRLDGERLVHNKPAPPVDLDHARSVVRRLRLTAPMELTRGCRFNCGYCQTPALWHGREKHRSIDSAVRFSDDYSVYVQFLSPNALGYQSQKPGEPNVAAIAALLSAIKERHRRLRLNFGNFPSEVRPEYVTREALETIRPLCDNRVLAIGAQSGSDRVLKRIGRGHRAGDVLRAVDIAQETGFAPYIDVIFGLPGASEEEEAKTRALAVELLHRNARVRGHVFMPLPGSRFENEPPGRLSPETVELMKSLEAGGAGDGDWREQAISLGPASGNETARNQMLAEEETRR